MPAEPRLAPIDRQQLVLPGIDVQPLIDEEHSARLIWQLIGRLDLSLYHAQIEAVEGRAGREHTDPQLLISWWIYAYTRGVSSARELARQCEYEPGCQWLCGCRRSATRLAALDHAPRRTIGDDRVQAEGGDGRGEINLRATFQKFSASRLKSGTVLHVNSRFTEARAPFGKPLIVASCEIWGLPNRLGNQPMLTGTALVDLQRPCIPGSMRAMGILQQLRSQLLLSAGQSA